MHVARAEDWVVILGFMGAAIALYVSAAFIILRPFLVPRPPKLGSIGLSVLALTFGSFLCLAYAFFVEPYNLQITHVRVPLHNFPAHHAPIYLVQVSDTHCDPQKRLEDVVIAEIKKIKPALIIFSGDAVNSLDGIPLFNKFAADLLKIAPTLAVKGDWDFAFDPHDVLRESGLDVLSGFRVLKLDDLQICFVGADSGASLRTSLRGAPKNLPTIAIYHNPDGDIVLDKDMTNVGLYLCGHTHGGQLALPFYGAMITQSVQGKTYESGLHKLNGAWIYTNRGLGMEGHFPRLRFFARPELTVFELLSDNGNG